ncbi:Importin subunit alpha-9 [Nymphaea thermarum]|nr:Importin subunit alpha-9 [Nymphaea thermarum]
MLRKNFRQQNNKVEVWSRVFKFTPLTFPHHLFTTYEKSSVHVAEQCAWAIGNLAGEGVEMRNILLAQGALPPLARMLLSNRGSTARTAAWTLSNLIKGPDPKAAMDLIKSNGVLESIIQHLKKMDDELATEVSWVVVYLSALSNLAVNEMVKSEVVHLLVERLAASEQLQLLIPTVCPY